MKKYLRVIPYLVPRILFDITFHINSYARKSQKYPLEQRYQKIKDVVTYISKGLRINYLVDGLDYLKSLDDKGCKYLLVPNHLSDFDPLALIYVLDKPTTFVGKIELKKMPFIPKALKAIDGEFIDRKDLKQSLKVLINVEHNLADNKCNYVIFPEGTRNKNPLSEVASFHPGTFKAATKSKVYIVPVSLYGTFRALKARPDYKSNPVFISFLKPISYDEYKDLSTTEIANYTHDLVNNRVNELKKLDEEYFLNNLQKQKIKYK